MPNFTQQRRAAIVPMFAVIFPVLMIFCGMAINLAYVQLSHTQMKIAVDAAVHAGGRRLGTPQLNEDGSVQTLDEAKEGVKDFAAQIAAMNFVAGRPAVIPDSVMEFGRSTREVRDDGSYTPYTYYDINSNQIPSSFRIVSNQLTLPHVFGPFTSSDGFTPDRHFNVSAASVSTQVDRDVVLVLDRSGSMLNFEDTNYFEATMNKMKDETYTPQVSEEYVQRRYRRRRYDGEGNLLSRVNKKGETVYWWYGWFDIDSPPSDPAWQMRNRTRTKTRLVDGTPQNKIGTEEYNDAANSTAYRRWYSTNVIYWLEVAESLNDDPEKDTWNHSLGNDPDTWTDGLSIAQQRAKLRGHMALYAHDYRYRYKLDNKDINWYSQIDDRQAPSYSRWYHLDRGVSVFLNVLGGGVDPDGLNSRDGTVQKEQVAILPFNAAPDTQRRTYGGVSFDDNNREFDYGLQNDGFPAAYVNTGNEPGYNVPHDGSSVSIREILPTICPYGGTAIGDSMREAAHIIRNVSEGDLDARARAFAAKTIVVLTDGANTVGDDPVDVARDEFANSDLIVHTITFTPGVSEKGKTAMASVAKHGKGKHYHTDNGAALAKIFEEIANNLPTILTQ